MCEEPPIFTQVEEALLDNGWALIWDSDEDQAIEDRTAHKLIEGEIHGEPVIGQPGWYDYLDEEAEGGPLWYTIYRGRHIMAVYALLEEE